MTINVPDPTTPVVHGDLGVRLVGDELTAPCLDGVERTYLSLDAGASTPALGEVAARIQEFLPWYSSVHRGAGYKSQLSTLAYEEAREAVLRFAGRDPDRDVAILCRNTTEAINHLAFRLGLRPDDVVATTVVEHHANLLPWRRFATCRFVEVGEAGTFGVHDVERVLDEQPTPKLLAITGASNVTGWMPPVDDIVAAAHARGVPVLVDAAQLAPHRPLPVSPDFVAWSGHKMYAPFGTGVLIGPRTAFEEGDPFLAGGGAVDLVDLDEVVWTAPPDREEAGSPNVLGAVALHAAIETFEALGWDAIVQHELALATRLRRGLAAIDGVRLLGPSLEEPTLAVGTFVVDGMSHALVAARLSAEHAIGVRHGCFCAHPYLLRLLGLDDAEIRAYRDDVLAGDRRRIPGAVRASASLSTTPADIDRFLDALAQIVATPSVHPYEQEPTTGDYWPTDPRWSDRRRSLGAPCSRG
ncbi:MAG: aminotransferase class V-fold PLP-dependent enzyme [Ilumatobacteraceae bacterium]